VTKIRHLFTGKRSERFKFAKESETKISNLKIREKVGRVSECARHTQVVPTSREDKTMGNSIPEQHKFGAT